MTVTTENTYTGDGSTVLFSFTFPYIETTDVKVSINQVDTTAFSLANATTVQMDVAPANGATVRVYRNTDSSTPQSVFFPGSVIRAQDLNANFEQALYVVQEAETIIGNSDAGTVTSIANQALATANQADASATTALNTANSAAADAATANNALQLKVDMSGSTGAAYVPAGTQAQRPVSPAAGYFRYNTELSSFEGYSDGSWGSIGGGATGGGTDAWAVEHDNTVTADYTITAGRNVVSAGPMTVNSGVTVTVPATSNWVIV